MPVHYDPSDPAVIANPFPVYHQLRRDDPVHWSPHLKGWVLTRHNDVRDALRDQRLSANRITPYLNHLSAEDRAAVSNMGDMLERWMVFMDPPDHTRIRGLFNRAFTSRALEALQPRIAALVDELLENMAAKGGRADFIQDFAYPLPAAVIALIIGVPVKDMDQLKAWSDDLATVVGSALDAPDKRVRSEAAITDMVAYFRDIIALRRRNPPPPGQEAIIDALISSDEKGDALEEAELVASAIFLLFAGHETTTNLFGNGLVALTRFPDQFAKLRTDEKMTEAAVEEMLRYDGPIGAIARIALEPYRIGDIEIQPGDRVFCMVNAANRDGDVFPDPDNFDLYRPQNRHIVFGFGIHFCLGAPLARLEGQIGWPKILQRLKNIELTAEPEWNASLVLRGLKGLPIRYDVA